MRPVLSWLNLPLPSPDTGYRVLDPCAGKGEALFTLYDQEWRNYVIPFGIELDTERGQFLGAKMLSAGGRFLIADAFQTTVSPDSMSVLFLNPPYDRATEKGRSTRLEHLFLKQFTPTLVAGGVLIFVVPQAILKHAATGIYLTEQYERFHILRFDEANDGFKQVVVFATKKAAADIDMPAANRLKTLGNIEWHNLPALPYDRLPNSADGLYAPPAVALSDEVTFRTTDKTPEELNELARPTHEAHLAIATTAPARKGIRSATPPRVGHIALLIPAGAANGTVITTDDNCRAIVKGRQVRRRVQRKEYVDASTEEQEKMVEKAIITDHIETEISVLDETGKMRQVTPEQMGDFLDRHLSDLSATLIDRMKPAYTFRSMNGYGKAIRGLNRQRRIPNTDRPGLMPAQMHTVAATATVLEKENAAIIVGEMGTGKTLIGTGVAAALAAHGHFKRGLIVCPPHLVPKWRDEVGITWPSCKTMIIQTATDVERLFHHPGPVLGVVKSTTLSLGPGWEHTYDLDGPVRQEQRTERSKAIFPFASKPWLSAARSEHIVNQTLLVSRPASLQTLARIERKHRPKRPQPVTPGSAGKGQKIDAKNAQTYFEYVARRGVRCPTCGAKQPLDLSSFTSKRLFCTECNGALHSFVKKSQRWPLAAIIKRAAKRYGPLDLLIADEVHQYKAADSDRGRAFGRVVAAARKTVALTGTLFGGKASTLFWLFYRLFPEFRREFTNTAATGQRRILETKFVAEYGLMESVTTNVERDGKTSGGSRATTITKEIPGLVPSIIRFLLPYCVFLNLSDLGYALPEYRERHIGVAMPITMRTEYDRLAHTLYEAVSQALARNDKGLLAVYMSVLLTWPEIPSRIRTAHDRQGGLIVRSEPFPEDWLTPKEEAVIAHIKDSLKENRPVMLFMQMTDKTDITDRWMHLLKAKGITTSVCRADTSDRIEWFEKERARGTQVIITHPRRVELGLDLLHWPEVIWLHEKDRSLYTLLQASRRAWRIGQERPVNVSLYYYEDTMQQLGLEMLWAKVAAHVRLNGGLLDEDAGTVTANDADSLEEGMAKRFLATVEAQRQLSHAQLLRQAILDGQRKGAPTAASFPDLASLSDEEALNALDGIIADTEATLAAGRSVATLDALFNQTNAMANGVRGQHAVDYLIDAEQYMLNPDDEEQEDTSPVAPAPEIRTMQPIHIHAITHNREMANGNVLVYEAHGDDANTLAELLMENDEIDVDLVTDENGDDVIVIFDSETLEEISRYIEPQGYELAILANEPETAEPPAEAPITEPVVAQPTLPPTLNVHGVEIPVEWTNHDGAIRFKVDLTETGEHAANTLGRKAVLAGMAGWRSNGHRGVSGRLEEFGKLEAIAKKLRKLPSKQVTEPARETKSPESALVTLHLRREEHGAPYVDLAGLNALQLALVKAVATLSGISMENPTKLVLSDSISSQDRSSTFIAFGSAHGVGVARENDGATETQTQDLPATATPTQENNAPLQLLAYAGPMYHDGQRGWCLSLSNLPPDIRIRINAAAAGAGLRPVSALSKTLDIEPERLTRFTEQLALRKIDLRLIHTHKATEEGTAVPTQGNGAPDSQTQNAPATATPTQSAPAQAARPAQSKGKATEQPAQLPVRGNIVVLPHFRQLLAQRAVTPEQLSAAAKKGKRLQVYTRAPNPRQKDSTPPMPNGDYLPVQRNGRLYLHRLSPEQVEGNEGDPVTGMEVEVKESVILKPKQFITRDAWEVQEYQY